MKEPQSANGLEYWAAEPPERLRRHRAPPHPRRAGDRPGQRLCARRRLRDGARLRHRHRLPRRRRFGLPEARVGRLPLDGGMVLLQRQIPRNVAMGMMLTGCAGSGGRACSLGHRQRGRARGPTSTPPSTAGSTTCSPARRSRCGQSSRRCATRPACWRGRGAAAQRCPGRRLGQRGLPRGRPRLRRKAPAGLAGPVGGT